MNFPLQVLHKSKIPCVIWQVELKIKWYKWYITALERLKPLFCKRDITLQIPKIIKVWHYLVFVKSIARVLNGIYNPFFVYSSVHFYSSFLTLSMTWPHTKIYTKVYNQHTTTYHTQKYTQKYIIINKPTDKTSFPVCKIIWKIRQ